MCRARERAAQQGTSVNSVLRQRLAQFVDDGADVGAAWDRFLDIASTAGGASPSGRRAWNREDVQRTGSSGR